MKITGNCPSEVTGGPGTAVAEATGQGSATPGPDQSVVMFDLKTLQVLGRIPAAEDTDAIVYDGPSNRVFTLNGDVHSSRVIDPRAGTLITNSNSAANPNMALLQATGGSMRISPISARYWKLMPRRPAS
jgi:hypothetical protein